MYFRVLRVPGNKRNDSRGLELYLYQTVNLRYVHTGYYSHWCLEGVAQSNIRHMRVKTLVMP